MMILLARKPRNEGGEAGVRVGCGRRAGIEKGDLSGVFFHRANIRMDSRDLLRCSGLSKEESLYTAGDKASFLYIL